MIILHSAIAILLVILLIIRMRVDPVVSLVLRAVPRGRPPARLQDCTPLRGLTGG